ncbi:hypothetical protein DPMN_160630, partial [Dreissena polymorpha]
MTPSVFNVTVKFKIAGFQKEIGECRLAGGTSFELEEQTAGLLEARYTVTRVFDWTREDEAIDGAGDVLDHLMGQARAIQRQLSQLTTGKVLVAVSREDELAINDAYISKRQVDSDMTGTAKDKN